MLTKSFETCSKGKMMIHCTTMSDEGKENRHWMNEISPEVRDDIIRRTTDAKSSVGDKIKRAIEEKGFTQAYVAEKVGISEAYLSAIIKGRRTPKHELRSKIAEAIGLPMWYFDITGSSFEFIPKTIYINIFKGVPCGNMENVAAEPIGLWPTSLFQVEGISHAEKNCSWIIVTGNSMEPELKDGDMVLVANGFTDGVTIKDGDMVIAVVGDKYTLKRIYEFDDSYQLVPDNLADYKPIIVKKDRLHIEYTCLYKVIWKATKVGS